MSARNVAAGAIATAVAGLLLVACGHGEQAASSPPSGKALPTVVVARAAGGVERRFEGRVEGIEQTTIRAQTNGRLAAVVHDVGDKVAEGTIVLKLRGVEQRAGLAQADSALSEAVAREAEARQRYQRIDDLYQRKVVAKAVFDEALASRDAATARVAAARAARDSAREAVGYADVAAPFSGVVAGRHVQPGDVIVPGQPLFDLVAPGRLRVVLDVPQRIAETLRTGASAVVMRDDDRVATTDVRVFTAAAPDAGTVRVWLGLPREATGFFAGQFVGVALPGTGQPDPAIPAGALVERSEVTAVYVVAADGSVALRQIRIGRRDGGSISVLAGLSPGERVVTDPLAAMRLLAGKPAR